MPESLFLELPSELIVVILSFLPLSDLVACRRTNKLLDSTIESSVVLQYLIELQVAGAVDNPSSSLPVSDRLRVLKARESAWEQIECTNVTSIRVDFNPSSIYDLTGGVFLLGESLYEPFARTFRETDALRWLRLSRASGDKPTLSPWFKIDLEASILDVGLAVEEHDLIAVVTQAIQLQTRTVVFDVHLLQIATGECHPRAAHPAIRVSEVPIFAGQCSVSVEIVGDMLAILMNFPYLQGVQPQRPGEFHMFDWLTGRQTLSRSGGHVQYLAFVFLSRDVVALTNCTENSLELCYIGDTLSNDSPDPQRLETVCRLALPRLAPVAFIRQVLCRSEPNPSGCDSTFGNNDGSPFRPDPKDSVVIFNFFIRVGEIVGRVYTLSLIMHRSALLAWLPPRPPKVSHSDAVSEDLLPGDTDDASRRGLHAELSTVPWAVWGPPATRWLNGMSPNNRWITTTCGQRHVAVGHDMPFQISILNFNQLSLRRFIAQHPHSEALLSVTRERTEPTNGETVLIHAVHEPSTLFLEVFEEVVVSCLPYLSTTTIGEYDYANVLLDEDRIIGINLDEDENISEIVVHSINYE
ncbi:hypothetical protein BKA93DRAFT_829888 [Sparassis latifolia]